MYIPKQPRRNILHRCYPDVVLMLATVKQALNNRVFLLRVIRIELDVQLLFHGAYHKKKPFGVQIQYSWVWC